MLDRHAMSALLHELWDTKHAYPQGYSLPMDDDALAVWTDWYLTDFHRESPSAEEDAMRARHAVLIQKLALIYAVCDGSKVVTEKHLVIGIDLVTWMWEQIKRLTPSWGRSIEGQIEERIKAVLVQRGAMKRRDVQGACGSRKWSSVEFGRVFDSMAKNGTLAVDPFGMVAISED